MSSEPPDEGNDWLFDFFEEGETHENVDPQDSFFLPAEEAAPARPARRGPSGQGRARARALGVVVLIILLVATGIIVAVGNASEAGPDTAYLTRVAVPAQDSQSVGLALAQLLAKPPPTPPDLEQSLRTLLSRQTQDLNETAAITPPPRLRAAEQEAVAAMQFRVHALQGLREGFREAVANPKAAAWSSELSLQADQLITSDVVWQQFFVTPVAAQIARDHATATVPASTFVADANLTSPDAMQTVLSDIQGLGSSSSQSTNLQLGSTGAAVAQWQQELNRWIATQSGMTALTVSGTFDTNTQLATETLQQSAGIGVDGVVGPETRNALATALASGGGSSSAASGGTSTTSTSTTTTSTTGTTGSSGG